MEPIVVTLLALTLTALADEPAPEAPEPAPVAAIAPEQAEDIDTVRLRVVMLPGFGMNASGKDAVDGVSVGLAGRAKSIEGVDAQGFLSWVDGDMKGAQLSGFVATAGGSVDGVQASGFVNYAGDADLQATGFVNLANGDIRGQFSGFANVANGEMSGMQGSGFLNVATGKENKGVQGSGFLNVAGDLKGVQGSGFANVAQDVKGVQATGGLNVAQDVKGVQAGVVNVAKEVNGVQAGVVNVGKKTSGVSVGVVNIAKESDAVNIGLFNFIGNGIHNVDIWSSESSALNADFKFGGKHLYTLIGGGTVRLNDPWWTFGVGMGLHFPASIGWVEVDASSWGIASGRRVASGSHNKLRGTVGLNLSKHLQPFVGASANMWWSGNGDVTARAVGLPSKKAQRGRVTTWPGVHAGIQF